MAQVYKEKSTRVVAIEVNVANIGILRNKGGLHMSPDGYGVIDDGITLRAVKPGDWIARTGNGKLHVLQPADLQDRFLLDDDQTEPTPDPEPTPGPPQGEVETL